MCSGRKITPVLDLGQKGTHNFTFSCGLSTTVSKNFTPSFWLIKAILTHEKADRWYKQPVESTNCFGDMLGKYRSETDCL